MSATVGIIGQGRLGFVQRFVQRSLLTLFLLSTTSLAQERIFVVSFDLQSGLILLKGELNGIPATLLLDTGANNSIVDVHSAGFDGLKLDALRSTGTAGAEGACTIREVSSLLSIAPGPIGVCVMDLADVSRRTGVRVDGFIGADVLSEFSSVRIDYRNSVVELGQ